MPLMTEREKAQGRKDSAKFRQRHPERAAELQLVSYLKRREQRLQTNRDWYALHREKVDAIKRTQPCLDCFRTYPPCVMEYHHTKEDKKDTVSRLLGRRKWSVIQTEIDKCELLCANCHRIRTSLDIEKKKLSGRPRKYPTPGAKVEAPSDE